MSSRGHSRSVSMGFCASAASMHFARAGSAAIPVIPSQIALASGSASPGIASSRLIRKVGLQIETIVRSAARQQMSERREPPFVGVGETGYRGRHGQHVHECCNEVGAEIGALAGEPDRNPVNATRPPRHGTDRHIGLAGERPRTALRQCCEPWQNRCAKRAQARRGVGNELPAGSAPTGLFECDHRLAGEDRGLARSDAVEPRREFLIAAYRHARAEFFQRADGCKAVRAPEIAVGVRFENSPQQRPLRGARCGASQFENVAFATRRGENLAPSVQLHSPWSNTRRANGRRLPEQSSVRHTSSSPWS